MTPEKYNDLPVYLLENTPMERAELNSVCNKVQNKHKLDNIFRQRQLTIVQFHFCDRFFK